MFRRLGWTSDDGITMVVPLRKPKTFTATQLIEGVQDVRVGAVLSTNGPRLV